MSLYMLLMSDTRSKGARAVKQMVGLFIVLSNIWRVESPMETGTHSYSLFVYDADLWNTQVDSQKLLA